MVYSFREFPLINLFANLKSIKYRFWYQGNLKKPQPTMRKKACFPLDTSSSRYPFWSSPQAMLSPFAEASTHQDTAPQSCMSQLLAPWLQPLLRYPLPSCSSEDLSPSSPPTLPLFLLSLGLYHPHWFMWSWSGRCTCVSYSLRSPRDEATGILEINWLYCGLPTNLAKMWVQSA